MESLRAKISWIIAAAAFILLTGSLAHFLSRPDEAETVTLKSGMADLDMTRIQEHAKHLTRFSSRMTGYPGADEAAQYILHQLRALGIPESNIAIQKFRAASPIVKNAALVVPSSGGNISIRLYPLQPNLARTSRTDSDGITGSLIDVGNGTDQDMRGKSIRESIVIMDWDSREEWMKVPEFGGKAVIFRGSQKSAGAFARMKYLSVPANIPRFYIEPKDIPALDAALALGSKDKLEKTGTIYCSMDWERVEARNILVQIADGHRSQAKNQESKRLSHGDQSDSSLSPLIFHAYYDSNSVVPERAPGAEQALGAATLLELGRYFNNLQEKPSRPVCLLFTGAHGQAMTGMSEFTNLLRQLEDIDKGKAAQGGSPMHALLGRVGKPGLLVGLDLSSRSSQMGVFCIGAYYDYRDAYLRPRFSVLGLKLAEVAAKYYKDPKSPPPVPSFVDCINLTSGRGWWTYFPYQSAFESEIPMLAGIPAITLATINDERFYVDTPDDTFDQIRFNQLESQLIARKGESAGLGVIAQSLAFWNGPFISSELRDESGNLTGRVVWLNQEKSYTPNDPLSGATVFLKRGSGDKALLGTCGLSPAIAGSNGEFAFHYLFMGSSWWQTRVVTVEAYGTASPAFIAANPEACGQFLRTRTGNPASAPKNKTTAGSDANRLQPNGDIIFGMDMARPQEYPWTARIAGRSQSVNLVMFPCKAISLFGLTDPRGYLDLTDAQILEASTKSPPFEYGRSQVDGHWRLPPESCVTIWANPTLRAYLTLGLGFVKKRLVLVNNPVAGEPGKGFVLSELENIPSMALQGASDMSKLDEQRVAKLEQHGINNPRVRKFRMEAKNNLDLATQALATNDYAAYRMTSEKAWALEGKAYGELLDTANNMIKGVLFYLALLLPFSYCMERLLFASGTIQKRMLWMLAIFGASFGILVLAHPAFRFTLTPFLVLLAFIILALAVTVGVLLVGKFDTQLRERKREVAGLHEDTVNTGNILIRAIDLGIANIRRRPQRGLLTGMTIVLVTFTLLSFTSVVPEVSISHLRHPNGVPSYSGLLARDKDWWGLPLPLLDSLKRDFGIASAQSPKRANVISTRAWFYSDYAGNVSQIDLRALPAGNSGVESSPTSTTGSLAIPHSSSASTGTFTVSSLLCMDTSEPLVTEVNRALIAGRWFEPGEEDAIILPAHIAQTLGYGPDDLGRRIEVFGARLSLIGILDDKKFDSIKDLDGEPLTPVNFVLQKELMMKRESDEKPDTIELYVHYPADQIAIVPLSFGRRLGATIRSVAVRMNGNTDPDSAAADFTKRSNQTILASDGKAVTLFAALDTSSMTMIGQIFIPIILGFLMVLGTMLGSVYERRREISVYNSVGLSPGNIAALFLAESSVYAMVGACMGYLLGQVVAKFFLVTGMLSSLSLNYSAGSTVFVSLFTMAIVLVSTLYPARQAFLAAIPDSHKRTAHGTGQEYAANVISFYLPFVATPGNTFAMQAYMHEYLDSLQGVTVGQLAVDALKVETEDSAGGPIPVLSFRAWLAPFDLGVGQDVKLRIAYREEINIYQYHLSAILYSGDQQNWRRLTPRFIQALRKQLLMWRILTPEEHVKYMAKGELLFEPVPQVPADTLPAPSGWLNQEKGLA